MTMITATAAAVSLLPPPQFRRHPGAIQLCTKPTFSPLLRLSPTLPLTIRRSTTRSCMASSLKKRWEDFTSLIHHVDRDRDRDYSDWSRLVDSVNAFEPHFRKLSDEELRAKTGEFRQRLKQGASLSDIQAEAFAVVREAAKRKLGMRHYDVQIIGGAVLQDGLIAEIKPGEGKTLVSTLAAYLNALSGEGVNVVTMNDYLAQRDAESMGRVHRFLGLSVGLILRACLLKSLDKSWCDHLVKINKLREEKWRSEWKVDPVEEYKVTSSKFFISMLSNTKRAAVQSLLQHLTSPADVESEEESKSKEESEEYLSILSMKN